MEGVPHIYTIKSPYPLYSFAHTSNCCVRVLELSLFYKVQLQKLPGIFLYAHHEECHLNCGIEAAFTGRIHHVAYFVDVILLHFRTNELTAYILVVQKYLTFLACYLNQGNHQNTRRLRADIHI